jgi:hypothetical protein
MTTTKTSLQRAALLVILLLSLSLFAPFHQATAQEPRERLNLAAGMGIPEFVHVGARYQWPQLQAGIVAGGFPMPEYRFITVTGEIFIHFTGSSVYSDRMPVYARGGFTYLRDESSPHKDARGYLNVRLGRDINISETVGFNVDAGFAYELFFKVIEYPNDANTDPDKRKVASVLPGVSVGVFYRLW